MLQVFCSTKRRPRIWMRMSLETCAMLQAIQFWDCILTCLGSALCQGVTRDLVEEPRFILPSQATATPVSRKRPCRSGQWHPGSKSCRNPRTKQRPRQNICNGMYFYIHTWWSQLAMQSETFETTPSSTSLYSWKQTAIFLSATLEKRRLSLSHKYRIAASCSCNICSSLVALKGTAPNPKPENRDTPRRGERCLHDGIHHAEGCFLFKTQLQEDCSQLVPRLNWAKHCCSKASIQTANVKPLRKHDMHAMVCKPIQ